MEWHARFSPAAGTRPGPRRRASSPHPFTVAAARRRAHLRSVYFMVHNIALMEIGAGRTADEVRRLLRRAPDDFAGWGDEYFRESVAAAVRRAVEDALAGVHRPGHW